MPLERQEEIIQLPPERQEEIIQLPLERQEEIIQLPLERQEEIKIEIKSADAGVRSRFFWRLGRRYHFYQI